MAWQHTPPPFIVTGDSLTAAMAQPDHAANRAARRQARKNLAAGKRRAVEAVKAEQRRRKARK